MNVRQSSGNSLKSWLFATALMFPVSLGVVKSFQATSADAKAAAATYSDGTLRVTIPYRAAHAGAGRLTVEVLNPEDEVLGRLERRATVSDAAGVWRDEIKLARALAAEDLVWHRLRYRFVFADGKEAAIEGTESISEMLSTPVLHVLGQRSYLAGGMAAVRVIVTDKENEPFAEGGTLRIELADSGRTPRVLFTGKLNRRGTAEAQFRFPPGVVGTHSLRCVVDTAVGSPEFTEQVRLEDKVAILLTTEKPIYQPGQTIHARALALDRANRQAAAGRKLTFEVEDSRGNKVFRKATATDEYGIASAEFALADEINLGAYHLRALMDATNSSDLALNVERYVLPKFKVAVDVAGNGNEARHGYRPGDRVTGTVRANYFFGKPVGAGEVTVKASGMDGVPLEAGPVEGKTDGEGAYRFDLQLPAHFAGGRAARARRACWWKPR